jgi:Tol biopolymer transport system component
VRWTEPVPGEAESAERSWHVVRRAYDERLPAPRRRDRRLLAAVVVGAAVVAAALSPPGLAVWGSLRDAVGNDDHLVALPSSGRVLVNASDGAWVVSADGSKRFLSGYRDASWSPHGIYLAAVRGNQLVALEPNGKVHWKLARRGALRNPQWSYEGFRIAYFAGGVLRIVNGDGTGDRRLTRDARVNTTAWQPRTHSLAYVNQAGNIVIRDVDRPANVRVLRMRTAPQMLDWTAEGRLVAGAPSPDGRRVAVVMRDGVSVNGRRVFTGTGVDGAAWSPDGRWLLLNWRGADEWVFLRTPARKLVTIPNIRGTFGDEVSVAGWCCP